MTYKLQLTEGDWAKVLNADDGAMFLREYLFQQQPQLVERIAAAQVEKSEKKQPKAAKAEQKSADAAKAADAKAAQ